MEEQGIIWVKDLTVKYGKKVVLNQLNLNVEPQSIHAIVGENGSGKTTLFDAIFKYHEHPGSIRVGDSQPNQISYLQTENYYYDYMTGSEYLGLIEPESEEMFAQWNEIFELPLNQYVSEYSTGMKKKLELMGILILNKDIVVLDEPFIGLDIRSDQTLSIILEKLKDTGKTILLSSHVLENLTKISDRISILDEGHITDTYEKADYKKLQSILRKKYKAKIGATLKKIIK